ncbi:MAG: ImmA/IrrE family metallo-endopeptidase [Candidatus Omnitrophota bacterium]
MTDIFVPFKNHDYIEKVAKDFLKKYHPDDVYPTPIEDIIELKMGIDIIPIPGLSEAIDGVGGFISSDLSNISIDSYVYMNVSTRARFTFAHEIGHAIMHKDVYKSQEFNSSDDWKDFMENFPEKEWSWLEWQANQFAGLVLVPAHHLEKRFKYHAKQIRSLGIENEEVVKDRAIELLTEDFIVSRGVIQIRLQKETENGNIS